MLKRLALSAIVMIAGISAPSLVAQIVTTSGTSAGPTSPDPTDDGWRLTKDGWTRLFPRVVSSPDVPHLQPPKRDPVLRPAAAAPTPSHWDLHPAALALLLVVGAISAFCLFPNERNQAAMRQSHTVF